MANSALHLGGALHLATHAPGASHLGSATHRTRPESGNRPAGVWVVWVDGRGDWGGGGEVRGWIAKGAKEDREGRELAGHGLVEMHSSRRWAYYTLAINPDQRPYPRELDVREQEILRYVHQHGSISRQECHSLLEIQPTKASYLLRSLRDQGYLRQEGQRRWARYVLP